MKHNSAITRQNQLEFWNQKAKQGFSWQSKNFCPSANIFGPRPFIAKSLKEAWDRQSLVDMQNFLHIVWNFKCTKFYLILYLLSYSALIYLLFSIY